MKVLHIILWKWRQQFGRYAFRETYTSAHVNILIQQLKTHCKLPFRTVCVTDEPTGIKCDTFQLWDDLKAVPNFSGGNLPSCYRRLKLFDPATQIKMGITPGDRIVSFDLDALILKDITSLFERTEEIVCWAVPGTRVKTVFNGSMFMFTAGELDWIWREFNPLTSPREACKAGFLGSDQAYLSHKLVNQSYVGRWTADSDGVMSYYRDIKARRMFSERTRIVFFAGTFKPWHKTAKLQAPWIARYINYQEHVNVA